MKKFCLALILATSVTLPSVAQVAVPVQWGGGGGGMRSGMRNSPKFRLGAVMRGISTLERGGKAPLSAAQAKIVVATFNAWSKKPRMTEADAKAVYMKINGVLTTRQKNELDKMAAQNRRFGGGGGGGMGGGSRRDRGGNPPSAQDMQQMRQRMQKMQGFMKTYNPFYPPAKYKELSQLPERMQEGFKRRYQMQQGIISQLAKKAKSAKA